MATTHYGTYPIQQYSAVPLTPLKYAPVLLPPKPADNRAFDLGRDFPLPSTLSRVVSIAKDVFESAVEKFWAQVPPLNMSDTSVTPLPEQFYLSTGESQAQGGAKSSKPFSALNISIGPAPGDPTRNKRMHPHENMRVNYQNEILGMMMDMWGPTVSYLYRCTRYARDPALKFGPDGRPGVSLEDLENYLRQERSDFHDGTPEGSGWRQRHVRHKLLSCDMNATMWTDQDVTMLETGAIRHHGGVLMLLASKWHLRPGRIEALGQQRYLDPKHGTKKAPFKESTDILADLILVGAAAYCKLTNTRHAIFTSHDLFSFAKFSPEYTAVEISAPIPFHSAPTKTVLPPPTQKDRDAGVDGRKCFLLSRLYDCKTKRPESGQEVPQPIEGLPEPWEVSVLQCWICWMVYAMETAEEGANEEEETRVEQETETQDMEAGTAPNDIVPKISEVVAPPAPLSASQLTENSALGSQPSRTPRTAATRPAGSHTPLARAATIGALPSVAGPSNSSPLQDLPFPLVANTVAAPNPTKPVDEPMVIRRSRRLDPTRGDDRGVYPAMRAMPNKRTRAASARDFWAAQLPVKGGKGVRVKRDPDEMDVDQPAEVKPQQPARRMRARGVSPVASSSAPTVAAGRNTEKRVAVISPLPQASGSAPDKKRKREDDEDEVLGPTNTIGTTRAKRLRMGNQTTNQPAKPKSDSPINTRTASKRKGKGKEKDPGTPKKARKPATTRTTKAADSTVGLAGPSKPVTRGSKPQEPTRIATRSSARLRRA
ncbi:hypothetical protein FRB94_011960 [Tulasnella sp. JGI-2019a]|nr:hypothetical protein FRB94_011960 [Tulasnella sp. JGI-2019a]KAG9034543.1 hypothetical protein FRB95_013110 [Tulasnella sp. JGI-2019a]